MEDGTQREDIAFRFYVLSPNDSGDLRCNIAWSSTSIKNIILQISIGRQSKISNDRYQSFRLSHHDVLRFDVAMHDAVIMHFLEADRHPLDKLPYLIEGKNGHVLVDASVQLSIAQKFQDHIDRVFRLVDAFAFEKVRGIECSKHLNFIQQIQTKPNVPRVQGRLLSEGLYCEMFLISDSLNFKYACEATFANLLNKFIVARKAILIEVSCKLLDPQLCKRLALRIELYLRFPFLEDPEAYWLGEHGLLGRTLPVQFIEGLEFEVEGELRVEEELWMALF